MSAGISIIICTYNGKDKLYPTLKGIASQTMDTVLNVELLLVDNASTDGTVLAASQYWDELGNPFPFLILSEQRKGASFARATGAQNASFSILIYVDDDNTLDPAYVANAWRIMDGNPKVAVIGGQGIPDFEDEKPAWFDHAPGMYGCGPQGNEEGPAEDHYLYTAGMVIRRRILLNFLSSGYKMQCSDRTGNKLSTGWDSELSIILRILGFELWYSPSLTFRHFMPAGRMTNSYRQKLMLGLTDAEVKLLPYHIVLNSKETKITGSWFYNLILKTTKLFYAILFNPYGRSRKLEWIRNKAYITGLFCRRMEYRETITAMMKLKRSMTLENTLISNNNESINQD